MYACFLDQLALDVRVACSGGSRGWAPVPDNSNPLVQHPWGIALSNKRMALALLARSHSSWMNVGLHEVLPELMGAQGRY